MAVAKEIQPTYWQADWKCATSGWKGAVFKYITAKLCETQVKMLN